MGNFLSTRVRPGWVTAVALGTLLGVIFASFGCGPTVKSFHTQLISMPVIGSIHDGVNDGYEPSQQDNCHRGLLITLKRAAEQELVVDLTATFENPNIVGMMKPDLKLIQVRDGFTTCGQLEVMAHELAHVFMPTALKGTVGAELFADAVSNLVTYKLHGIDPTPFNARGNRAFKSSAYVLVAYELDINRVSVYIATGQWPKL